MKHFALIILLALASSFPVAADLAQDINSCRSISDSLQRLVCYDTAAGKGSKGAVAPAASTVTPRNQVAPMPLQSTSTSCPCGTGNTCTGPRGGIYCINSKGNKRYYPR